MLLLYFIELEEQKQRPDMGNTSLGCNQHMDVRPDVLSPSTSQPCSNEQLQEVNMDYSGTKDPHSSHNSSCTSQAHNYRESECEAKCESLDE